jgi:DNA-binding MarR family transcriptional regulator
MTTPRSLEPEEWELWHVWMQAQRLLNRELDRGLQRDYGISKTDFSVLVSLHQAPGGELRVSELVESLAWEKSRVSHQLTRMEHRELVERAEYGASGRRSAVRLTGKGRDAAEHAIRGHADNIRRYFFEALSPEQAEVIRCWSQGVVDRLEAGVGQAASDPARGSETQNAPDL